MNYTFQMKVLNRQIYDLTIFLFYLCKIIKKIKDKTFFNLVYFFILMFKINKKNLLK